MNANTFRGAAHGGHFQTHLREAIEINKERLPSYARLTAGDSIPISRSLIRTEYISLPFAYYFDRRAAPLQASGIGFVQEEFVSMSTTPPFQEAFDNPPRLADFSRRAGGAVARRIWTATRADGFAGARAVVENEISAIEDLPSFHCMLRHLLESALRIVELAPRHEQRAQQVGARSPSGLSRQLLRLHLLGLDGAARLDARAAPLQARGVPILYQDVPPIPRVGD